MVLFFKRAWSGTPESFHPMAQGLSEALGQRGIWQVNCHASTLPETTARGKPCLAPALCCIQSSKPKPAVDFFPLSELGSDLLCRCCLCSCQEALHHSPRPGNTSRQSCSHQLCTGVSPSKLTYRNKTERFSFQAKQNSKLFS